MKFPCTCPRAIVVLTWMSAIFVPWSLTERPAVAQQPPATQPPATSQKPTSSQYSPEVVAKAEGYLREAGMRRSGKTIRPTEVSEISRAITALTRQKRELRLRQQAWQAVADQIAAVKRELRQLNVQQIELNLQLTRVRDSDVQANNRIVGLLNASRAHGKELIERREELKKLLASKRESVSEAEGTYAETVLAIRKDFVFAKDILDESLAEEKVKIAMRVLNTNYGTPAKPSASDLLAALDKRIAKIEQEIFSETIKLDVRGGSLLVDVAVGSKTTRMVVDSGASLITLPARTAAELGVEVPLDARELRLVLADGSSIPARAVTLPRVRVGEFEAENVEAAVLDAAAIQAEPLLGMSYLENFKFEIDSTQKRLKLLRVATD